MVLQSILESVDQLEEATNLGHGSLLRYHKEGEQQDLDRAIEQFAHVLDICPPDHPCRAVAQSNLAMATFVRCGANGANHSLEIPITLYHNALAARQAGHPDRPSTLIRLAVVLLARFQMWGCEDDAMKVTAFLTEAVDLTSAESHENQAAIFALLLHYRRESSPDHQVDQTSPGQNFSLAPVCDNAMTLVSRMRMRFRDLEELHLAISLSEASVQSISVLDNRYIQVLTDLGVALWYRFLCLRQLSDIGQAILRYSKAIHLIPDNDPYKPNHLNILALFYLTRFEIVGEPTDLDQVISRYSDAVELTPEEHPGKSEALNNLANAISTRFERLGELSDLEQAISRHRHVLEVTPNDHPDKLGRLNNLANCFLTRFNLVGESRDLEEAISKHQASTEVTPDGHPYKSTCLSNLALCFLTRFDRFGESSFLDQAISKYKNALELTPEGDSNKSAYLNGLAVCFRVRFEHLEKLCDLKEAISRQRDAVELTPDDHRDKHVRLNNLALCCHTRFKHLGELSDLEQAILIHQDALKLTPHGHPDIPKRLYNLADCFRTRFERLGKASDLEQALLRYSLAACASTGPIGDRFRASQHWILCARVQGHHSLLYAYSVAIGLLPQLAWIGLSLAHRHRELLRGAGVAREAAAAVLDSDRPETAVEWLEQGRSIVWGGLFQLRSSHEELSSAYPDHAHRLRQISDALEHAALTRDKSMYALSGSIHIGGQSQEKEAVRHRELAMERDRLLQEIRTFPGFERFLLHKEFSQLRASARSGPVVILNAAESRCDALILVADLEDAIHVPLPNLTLKRSVALQNTLNMLSRAHNGVILPDDRDGQPASRREGNWESILSSLWKCVVKPVLDALAFSVRDTMISDVAADLFIGLQTDARGLVTDLLVSDGSFDVSSYPCSWPVWYTILGT